MKAEFVIQRQGKSFVLYAGLLDLATERGLTGIEVEALQITATLAVFKATASFADGRRFSSHGDASPDNVGRTIGPHFIRMAETRAKARALRDSLNIGAVALEELGPDEDVVPTPPLVNVRAASEHSRALEPPLARPAPQGPPRPIRAPAPPAPGPPSPAATPDEADATPQAEPVTDRTRLLCAAFKDAAEAANPRVTLSLPRQEAGEAVWLDWLARMSAKVKVPAERPAPSGAS